MENSLSSLEQKVISYLYKYGNTKETELISYGMQKQGMSEEGMAKFLDEMLLCGRLERVMHKELEPMVTYFKHGRNVPFELEIQAISDSMNLGKVTKQQIEKAKEILEEAKAAAEKRIKRKRAL